MQLSYSPFYKRHGVRTPQMLLAPHLEPMETFEFPMNSIHHYVVFDAVTDGPPKDEYLYRKIEQTKKIYVEHVLHLSSFEGAPKAVSVALLPYIRQFHSKNKRYRLVKSASEMTNPVSLAVVNYALVARAYRYTRSYYADYYRWHNIQQTVWNTIEEMTKVSERQHYLFMHVPAVLPSVQRLNDCAAKFSANTLRKLPSQEALFLLEVWKWLSVEHRNESFFSHLSREQLQKVNLVYQDETRWAIINLGDLDSWRFVKGVSPADQKVRMQPSQLQKYFLRMMLAMTDARGKAVVKEASDEEEPTAALPNTKDAVQREDDAETGTTSSDNGGMAAEIPQTTKQITNIVEEPTGKAEVVDVESGDRSRADLAHALEKSLDEDLAELEKIEQRAEKEFEDNEREFQVNVDATKPVSPLEFDSPKTPVQAFTAQADKLAEDGILPVAQFKRMVKLAEESENIPSPWGEKMRLKDFVRIDPELTVINEKSTIKDQPTILDKTMLHSSLLSFDKRYISKVLNKDIGGMVTGVQKAGFLVTKYEVEPIEDIMGSSEMHAVTFQPLEGKSTILRFKMPKVGDDGVWVAGGVKYRLRKQRTDMPIRKVGPDLVALTTYYGKSFVSRNERKVNNFSAWLQGQVMAKGLSNEDQTITNLAAGDVFDNKFYCPRAYSALAMAFKSFSAHGYDWVLDHREREKLVDAKTLTKMETNGKVLIASNGKGKYLLIDQNDVIYEVAGSIETVMDDIVHYLGLSDDAPIEFTEARVFGKDLPVGFILGYLLGLDKLLELLHVRHRSVEAGRRLNLTSNEYALVFSDETLVFDRDNKIATLILAGFRVFEKTTRTMPAHTFNKRGVYLNLLDQLKFGVRYLREIELMDQLFVDSISGELLAQMKEPQTYQGLLVRATELLTTDRHPDLLDMNHMRIRGYERLAGVVYGEVIQAIREHKAKGNRTNAGLEMNPFNIWKKISQDPAISIVNEINPIENLKEMEAVTFGGVGGRSSRSMVKKTRAYHRNDMGVISESTVDSGDVAINTYLSADPRFNSLRGTSDRYVVGRDGHTSLISTSALMSPGSDMDDPKRVNFIGIQNSHVVACDGYKQASVRTGYEQVLAHRVSPLFAVTAKDSGEVIARNDKGIVVKYKDGRSEGFELGRIFGESRGMTIPHALTSKLQVGSKFNKGDVVLYNAGFFEPDMLNPSNVVLKSGIIAKTVLLESGQTLEDASSISKELSIKLTTQVTKIKNVTVTFDQALRNIIQVGAPVEPDTVLCFIEDAVTASGDLFNEESLNTLKLLSTASPMAKVQGIVEKIEVIYNGELEDMSDSLRDIAEKSDREIASKARSQGKRGHTGQVLGSVRVGGTVINPECAMVRFYITSRIGAGVGDKGVFANQLKTVFSEVLPRSMKTESGKKIDAVFGSKSIADRIVSSPDIIGTTNVLLDVIGKKALAIYRGKK